MEKTNDLNEAPEQSYYDESMLRPMSLANVSEFAENMADKSKNAYQIWNEYRGARATETPTDNFHDDEEDQANSNSESNTPHVKELSANKSLMRKFSSTEKAQGFTFNELHEKLDKIKLENIQLKIRIHFLEESQGLLDKPDDKENVYRINLDLKVQVHSLQQQLSDNQEEIRQLIEHLEVEKEKEKKFYEDREQQFLFEIEELKQQLNNEPRIPQNEVRQSLLGEAFGSMILDSAPEDNNDAIVEELKLRISSLEAEIEIEKDSNQDLNKLLQEQKARTEELEKDHHEKLETLTKIVEAKDEIIKAHDEEIRGFKERIEDLEVQNEEIIEDNDKWKEVAGNAMTENDEMTKREQINFQEFQTLKSLHENRILSLENELSEAKKALDEESSSNKDQETYLNLKLTEIANLHKEIVSLNSVVSSKDEEIEKMTKGLNALAQVTEEQSNEAIKQGKELKKVTMMYERLVSEYEIAKAKVRKYRSEKQSRLSSSSSLPDHVPMDAKASYYIKQGADKALMKAKEVYNEQILKLDNNHKQAMKLMQKRLNELAICLEQILNNGLLDISDSLRDVLQTSLNESRRLSKSFMDCSSLNVTLDGAIGALPEIPFVEVTIDDLELEINADIDNVVNEMKAEHEQEVKQITAHYEALIAEARQEKEALEAVQNEAQCVQSQLLKSNEKVKFLEAEKTDLRIKYGNIKEKFKTLEDENVKLRDKTKTLKEMSKMQNENEMLRNELQELKNEMQLEVNRFASSNAEMDTLRRQLDEALETIRKDKERKDKLDKVLRKELAKTHAVLKKTKNAMDTIDENKENLH